MTRAAVRFRPLIAVAALLGFAELALWLAPNVIVGFGDPYRTDFSQYHTSARIALTHGWAAVYDLDLQRRIWQETGPMFFFPVAFTPPMLALVVPLALLPLKVAVAIWLPLMLVCLVAAWALTAPGSLVERGAHLAAALAWLPVSVALAAGQVDMLVIACVAASWLLLVRRRDVPAGLLLCVVALKPQLVVLVPPALLVAGYRRAFVAWLAGSTAIATLSVAALGVSGTLSFIARTQLASREPDVFVTNPGLTISGLFGGGAAGYAAQLAIVIVALAVARRFTGPGREARVYAAGLVGSLLASAFMHVYDMTVLLLAGWLCLRSGARALEWVVLVCVYVAGDVASVLKLMQPVPLLELAWLLVMAVPVARLGVSDGNRKAAGRGTPEHKEGSGSGEEETDDRAPAEEDAHGARQASKQSQEQVLRAGRAAVPAAPHLHLPPLARGEEGIRPFRVPTAPLPTSARGSTAGRRRARRRRP